jgi:hypothetical protein
MNPIIDKTQQVHLLGASMEAVLIHVSLVKMTRMARALPRMTAVTKTCGRATQRDSLECLGGLWVDSYVWKQVL